MKESKLISNDERREVAARLRKAEIDNLGLTYSAHLGEAIGECVRLVSGHECLVEGGLNRLADLIEPEERTCRIEERRGGWYCTECDELAGTVDTESELFIDGNAIEMWKFCPNCGAKVIE